MNNYKKVKIVNYSSEESFEEEMNYLLSEGWEILSTDCGFCNSEKYDFVSSYQAILGLPGDLRFIKPGFTQLPKELTAENGAKVLLSGEFFEVVEIENPDFDESEPESEDNKESYERKIFVTWSTIKDIYKTIVEHYS